MADELTPFDSIESAQEFMALLQEAIADAVRDVQHDLDSNPAEQDRRAQALQLALYKLGQLSSQVHKSRRTLNDLRTIRNLLLNDRWVEAETLVR